MEVLLAAVLVLLAGGIAGTYLASQVAIARAQPEAADLQQRARAVADVLSRGLAQAGEGTDQGSGGGAIACCLPVVQPRRIGTQSPDPAGTALEDVVTVLRLAAGAIPARLGAPLTSGELVIDAGAGCPVGDALCGLREDDTVVVFDAEGHHDFFLVGQPGPASAPLTLRQTEAPALYASGAATAAAETRTYYFDETTRQLRQYDGHRSDVPVVDDVVALRFEYWGDRGAPARARLEEGSNGCWFDAAGVPRFGTTLPGAPLVKLSIDELRDGRGAAPAKTVSTRIFCGSGAFVPSRGSRRHQTAR